MRKWRVGTISMGLTLIMLGIILMISQFQGWDVIKLSLSWWPIILIVLGLEIVMYLFLSKQENPIVKYDFISIIFIGILGSIGIAVYLFMSVGLLDEVKAAVHSESKTGTLPTTEQHISSDIEKIVVTPSNNLSIETNKSNLLTVFGTFESSFMEEEKLKKDDVVQIQKVGSTLYVNLLDAPVKRGIIYENSFFHTTLSLPNDVKVEIRSGGGNLDLHIDDINNKWKINRINQATLDVNDSNVTIEAESTNQELAWDVGWNRKMPIEDEKHKGLYYYNKVFGNGGSGEIQFDYIQDLTISQVGPRLEEK